jgi:hypothetical protein
MRKLAILSITIAALTFSGCEELENLCGIGQGDLGFAEDYNRHLNAAIYIYQQTDRAMRDSVLKVDGFTEIDGATCTRTPDSVIVDFGNGTVGADGRTRYGSYRIAYNGEYTTPGSSASLMLKNYQEGEQAYEGGIGLTNTTSGTNPEIEVSVNNITVDSLQLGGIMGAEWLTGFETETVPEDDSFQLTGGLTLTNTSSTDEFVGTITDPLVIENSCDFTFVGGAVDLVPSNTDLPQLSMDFIAGDCSNLFTVFLDCEGNQLSFSYPIK